MLGTNLLGFLDGRLVAARERSENAECSEGGTDEQGGLEATDKGLLQTNETRWGKVLGLWGGQEGPRRRAS